MGYIQVVVSHSSLSFQILGGALVICFTVVQYVAECKTKGEKLIIRATYFTINKNSYFQYIMKACLFVLHYAANCCDILSLSTL